MTRKGGVKLEDSPVASVVVAARNAFALSLLAGGARVSGERLALLVRLPDVELGAARAEVSLAGVGVVLHRHPVLGVGLAVDPLDVVRALGVAVARAVLGAGLVRRVLCGTAIGVHRDLRASFYQ